MIELIEKLNWESRVCSFVFWAKFERFSNNIKFDGFFHTNVENGT